MKGCLKGCLTSIVLLIVAVVVLGFLGWKFVKKQFLTASPIAPIATVLEIDTGTVSKNGSLAKTGDTLNNGDKLHTAKNSAATLTFPDNSVLRLDENTDISITSASNLKISIFQSLGRTWSKTNHSFEIQTPTAVATATNAAFATTVNPGQSTNIDVDNGAVKVSTLSIDAGFGIDLASKQQKLFKRVISEELKNSPWYKNNQLRDKQLTAKQNSGDLAKIWNLVQKAQSGQLNLTPTQQTKLQPLIVKFQTSGGKIDASMAPDIAQALAIVSPEDFSDTAHWTTVVRSLIPLLSKLPLPKPTD